MSNKEIRALSLNQFKEKKWGTPILVCFLFFLILMVPSITVYLSFVIYIIAGPIVVGLNKFFINFATDKEYRVKDLFSGFEFFGKSLITYLLFIIYTLLWTLLFIIPGIIKSYSYVMTLFILAENPTLTANQAITESRRIMNGYKWKFFCLQLSFIGWYILSILSLGIGFFWLVPYIHLATANFYLEISKNKKVASENSEIGEVNN